MFSSFLALCVTGIIVCIILFALSLTNNIRNNVELHVYLRDISETERLHLIKVLSSKDYVSKQKGVAQISYLSKEEAEQKFISKNGNDHKNILTINPFKASLKVKIHPNYSSSLDLQKAKNNIETISGVFEVNLTKDWKEILDSINNNLQKVVIFLISFMIISILTIVIMTNNTIKLALYSQRFLIRSMQLVGAKHSFIMKPFLQRSFSHGFISGLFASILLNGCIQYAIHNINDLNLLYDSEKILILLSSLPFVGALINITSTYSAVQRHLKMSLDELY